MIEIYVVVNHFINGRIDNFIDEFLVNIEMYFFLELTKKNKSYKMR